MFNARARPASRPHDDWSSVRDAGRPGAAAGGRSGGQAPPPAQAAQSYSPDRAAARACSERACWFAHCQADVAGMAWQDKESEQHFVERTRLRSSLNFLPLQIAQKCCTGRNQLFTIGPLAKSIATPSTLQVKTVAFTLTSRQGYSPDTAAKVEALFAFCRVAAEKPHPTV